MKKYLIFSFLLISLGFTNKVYSQEPSEPICVSDWSSSVAYPGGYVARITFTLNSEQPNVNWSFNTSNYSVVSQSSEGIVVDFYTDAIATEQNTTGSVVINACASLYNYGCTVLSYCHNLNVLVP